MKTPVRFFFLSAMIVLGLTPTKMVVAQETSASAEAESAPQSSSEAAGGGAKSGELRRLDIVEVDGGADAEAATAPGAANAADAPKAPDAPEVPEAGENAADAADDADEGVEADESGAMAASRERDERAHSRHRDRSHHRGAHGSERVAFGHNATLKADESANAVVSILGSSTAEGNVREAVVSILGSSTTSGRVGDAVVSVLGNSRVTGGSVGQTVVSVLGSTYVNGEVYGEVVAVLGNIELGPDAIVHGQLTCVGGLVKRDPMAQVHGQVNNVAFGWGVEHGLGGMEWLQAWVAKCLFLLRPLAFGENLMWAWWIALAFLGLYAFLALVAGRSVETCVQTLEQRPGYSMLAALLTVLLSPIVITLLAITVVGLALVPFLGAALFFGTLFGKVVILAFLGRLITRHAGSGFMRHPAVAVLIGGVIVLLLYTVPVLGFLVYKVIGVLGLGVVIYTLMLGSQRKTAAVAAASGVAATPTTGATTTVAPTAAGTTTVGTTPATGSVSPAGDVGSAGVAVPLASAGFVGAGTTAAPGSVPEPVPPPVVPPPMPTVSVHTMVRAGFWIRLAASAIDALLVLVAIKVLPNFMQPNFLLVFAVYCIVLWALKGTTVGGIVCNLKVVRIDDRPLDWPTALVRALGGFLSLVAAGIGFAWVAFDEQRQSWHDKIAGTTIVQVPKGVSLV